MARLRMWGRRETWWASNWYYEWVWALVSDRINKRERERERERWWLQCPPVLHYGQCVVVWPLGSQLETPRQTPPLHSTPLPTPTPDWDVSLLSLLTPPGSAWLLPSPLFTFRMGCGVQTERAKISCLRLLVGSFNFLLGVRQLLITFDHLYRQSHLAIIARITVPQTF